MTRCLNADGGRGGQRRFRRTPYHGVKAQDRTPAAKKTLLFSISLLNWHDRELLSYYYPRVSTHLYTVDQVAEFLDLHVKTVRRYLREGRLKGKRIGKEYRVARADLDAFTGGSDTTARPVARTRHVIASSILDVDAISPDESHRITTMVMAALNARRGEADFPRVDSIYYEEQAKLRITITANPVLTCELLRMINALLRDGRGDDL